MPSTSVNPAIEQLTERARGEANQAMAEAEAEARELSETGASRMERAFGGWSIPAEAVTGSPAPLLLKRAGELNGALSMLILEVA